MKGKNSNKSAKKVLDPSAQKKQSDYQSGKTAVSKIEPAVKQKK